MEDINKVIEEELKDNKNSFTQLGELRPNKSRINLDSFTSFNKAEAEKKVELKKQLLIKKVQLLKSLGQEEGQKEIIKELSGLYGVDEKDLSKAIDNSFEKYTQHRKPISKKSGEATHDDIEKGIVSDLAYSYDKNGLTFNKTGKELKQQLPTLISELSTKLGMIKAEMDKCVEEAGDEPSEAQSSYDGIILNRYPWESYRTEGSQECTNEQKAMRKYNDLCYNYADIMRDLKTSKTLLNNLDDKKKYTLNLRQLEGLGF